MGKQAIECLWINYIVESKIGFIKIDAIVL